MPSTTTTYKDIAKYLEDAAKSQRLVFYSDIVDEFPDLPKQLFPFPQHPLSAIFDELDHEDHRNKTPFRTAIVVSKEKRIPGPGFFKTFGRLKASKMTKSEQDAYWAAEVRDVFSHYASN